MTKIWAPSLRNEVRPDRKQGGKWVLEFKNGMQPLVFYGKESDAAPQLESFLRQATIISEGDTISEYQKPGLHGALLSDLPSRTIRKTRRPMACARLSHTSRGRTFKQWETDFRRSGANSKWQIPWGSPCQWFFTHVSFGAEELVHV